MVIDSARRAFKGIFAQRSRWVVLKSVGLTILLFLGIWLGLQNLVSVYLLPFIDGWVWLTSVILWVLGAGVIVAGGFLLGPVTAIFAGLFLDEVAEHIESAHYPEEVPGTAMATVPSLFLAIKFGLFVLLANLIALLLVWVAGFGVIIFFLVNGFLLGREYFQFAAMRFLPESDVVALRRKFSFEIFLSGLVIAAFMSVPFLNLLTPVFAAIMMVHLYKTISHQQLELPAQ
ncbi:MAG: sulfate transporter family protein [Pseudomonadota bacterium]